MYGLIITIVIFVCSNMIGSVMRTNEGFITRSFVTHTSMFILSLLAIYVMKKSVQFHISAPKIKTIFKPIIYGILATIVVNGIITIITKILGMPVEQNKVTASMTPLQVFLFVFVLASIAEELLFRGFLQDLLSPLTSKKFKLLNREISLPVLISAVTFGLSHLILILTGAHFLFLLKTILFTMVLGLIAGYYQGKYNNHVYAVIVHMSANLMGLLGSMAVYMSP